MDKKNKLEYIKMIIPNPLSNPLFVILIIHNFKMKKDNEKMIKNKQEEENEERQMRENHLDNA